MSFRFLLIPSLLLAAVINNLSAADPSEQFLSAYQSFQQGENLERGGNISEAINKYRFAESLLVAISKNNPSWQKPVVEYRLKKTRESLDRLQGGGPSDTATAVPAAAPGSDGPSAAPPQQQRGAPSITIVPPSATAQADRAPGAANNSAETKRLHRMVEDLQSQLQEAHDALNEQKRRASDLENAEWVKKRSELANELDVAKRRISDLEHDLKSRASWGDDLKNLQKKLDNAVADKLAAEEQFQDSLKKSSDENAALLKHLQEAQNKVVAAADAKQKIEQLTQDVEKGREASAQLQVKLEHSEQVARDSAVKNEELQKEFAKAHAEAEAAARATSAAKAIQVKRLADSEADRSVLEEERTRLLAKVDQASLWLTSLKQGADSAESLKKEVGALKVQLAENAKSLELVSSKLTDAEQANASAQVEAANRDKSSKNLADLLTQQNTALQEQLKAALAQMTNSVDHSSDSAALQEQIKKLQQQIDLNAKNYADSQQQLSELTKTQPDQEKALKEKEKALADAQGEASKLHAQLDDASQQISNLKKQGDQSGTHLKELQDQLAERDAKIARLKKKKGNAADADQTIEENTLLRGIVLREIKEEAKRAQAHRLMEEELRRLNVQSDTLQTQMAQMAAPAVQLTPEERALFKDAQLVVSDEGGASLQASIAAPMSGGTVSTNNGEKVPEVVSDKSQAGASLPSSKNGQTNAVLSEGQGQFKELLARAKEEFDRQDYLQAENTFLESLKLSPNDYFALANLGVVEFQLGKLKEAEEALKKASDQTTDSSFALTTLGIVHYRQQRLEDAEKVLRKAVAINQQDFTAHNYLGIVLAASGKGKAGESEIMKAVEINPNYADAHFNLAVIYATGKPPAKMMARKHYNKSLELGSPPDPSLEHLLQ